MKNTILLYKIESAKKVSRIESQKFAKFRK